MTLSLTCSCGAHLEIDQAFAGKTVNCPDCQHPIQVPAAQPPPPRTSGYALASLIVALVGAFTLLGTLLAIVLGMLGLASIRRQAGQLTGRGYALAGIVLGVVLTGVSLFAYTSVELFGLDNLLRQPQWAGRVDYSGPLEVMRSSDGFAIKRPSSDWGVVRNSGSDEARFLADRHPERLLLVNTRASAYVACLPEMVPDLSDLESCRKRALELFARSDLSGLFGRKEMAVRATVKERDKKELPALGDTECVEMLVDKQAGGQEKTFVLRVYKKRTDNVMYIVAGGAAKNRFAKVEAEVRTALDGFRLLERDRPRDMQMRGW